ncbi:LPXTG cell wall anchor domain-containing protein [Enterococcus ureasiticus]|uniref:Cell wall protein n=1 Tax=Enterococcus ureasiticus TaxID=903984 RepID=A0A1E5GN62_9ENTE|nr:LPXTG cell wall anchor domain-containing protein [Enterococcus ureasiticus]OEG14148.1 cell wall protein [Enterococcus ureasiticus]
MIKKKIQVSVALVFLVFVGSILTVPSISVYGMEAAVQTDGEIVFTQESTQPTSTTSEPSSDSSEEPIKKPGGKFPSTGELILKSLSVSGIAIIMLVFGVYLFKRKKSVDKKDGQSQ